MCAVAMASCSVRILNAGRELRGTEANEEVLHSMVIQHSKLSVLFPRCDISLTGAKSSSELAIATLATKKR